MREQADLWARRWLAAVFVVLITTALWPRGQSPDAAQEPSQGRTAQNYAKVYVARFLVSNGSRGTATIPRGARGHILVTLHSSSLVTRPGTGFKWRIISGSSGPPIATDIAPAGWAVTGMLDYKDLGDSIYVPVDVPESAAAREHVLYITLYSTEH